MGTPKSFIYSLESIDQVAETLLFQYPKFRKWALYGPMGAGKTTLIKVLAKKLGSIDEGSSPTFAIANQYETETNTIIYHLDLFRLKSIEEAFNAGIYEIISSEHAYCFVEWPEWIEEWMNKEWLRCEIKVVENDTRIMVVEKQLFP